MVVHGKPRQTTENTNLLDAKENNELLDNFHTFHFSRLMLANGALMLAHSAGLYTVGSASLMSSSFTSSIISLTASLYHQRARCEPSEKRNGNVRHS